MQEISQRSTALELHDRSFASQSMVNVGGCCGLGRLQNVISLHIHKGVARALLHGKGLVLTSLSRFCA